MSRYLEIDSPPACPFKEVMVNNPLKHKMYFCQKLWWDERVVIKCGGDTFPEECPLNKKMCSPDYSCEHKIAEFKEMCDGI